MWYLTNNKVEFEGHTFTQIKRQLPNGGWEFGGYVEELPKIRGEFWIEKNSYLFKDCVVNGRVRIKKNCVIKNSELHNNMIIGDNCVIINSNIQGHSKYATWFENGCIINNQKLITVGRYFPYHFEDGTMEADVFNDVILNMTDNYCRVNCLTMTYETAWTYLNDEEKWEFIKSQHPETPKVYELSTVKWLRYWCEKQLKRKQGRAK